MSPTIIEKLLNGAEVEWKPLGEIVKIKTGALINKNTIQNNPGVYPVINSGKEPLGYIKYWNTECDPIGITTRGAGVGSVTWQEGRYFRGNLNYSVTIKDNKKLLVRYLFYSLTSQQKDIQNLATYSGIPALNAAELKKLRVPVPPLSVQKEIVRILDAFTAHTAELTAELNERKKQYNYYRDKLLTFSDDEVEWKKLGDITQPTQNIKWKHNNQHYLYIDLTSVDRENNVVAKTVKISSKNAPSRAQKIVEKNDVIFATTRPTLQRYTIIDEKYSGQIASSGYCVLRAKYKNVLPKWIYYNIASNKFLTYVEVTQSGSAYPSISDVKVKEFIIPIPSIKTQERIVSILDKFDALTTSISEGLPREIELRNKQYEYYRDQLLNFPKPENDAIKHNSTNR